MAETIVSAELDEEVVPSSYTPETEPALAGTGQSIIASGTDLGRRKEAIVRICLVPNSGKRTINDRAFEDYFPNRPHQRLMESPFVLLDIDGRFDAIARINGSGASNQASTLRLGVSCTFNEIGHDTNHPAFKKVGFPTRDACVAGRRKVGLKKAHRVPQFSRR